MIRQFKEEYSFLSNFYHAPVSYNGFIYPNNEAAFQAQKSLDPMIQKEFTLLNNPVAAKRKGKQIELRYDWEEVKVPIMYSICFAKFYQNPDLLNRILDTGDQYLAEGNNHGDRFWGVVNGEGENQLGIILMRVRSELGFVRTTPSIYI